MNLVKTLLKHIFVGIISAIIFSSILVGAPASRIDAFHMALLFGIPIYLLGGVPCSLLIEKILQQIRLKWVRYLSGILLYIIGGSLVIALAFLFIQGNPNSVHWIGYLYGGLPALLYYHLLILTNWLIRFIRVF